MSEGSAASSAKLSRHPANDEKNFVLHRAAHNFVILNLYPYISGHLMIAPNEHLGEFGSAAEGNN